MMRSFIFATTLLLATPLLAKNINYVPSAGCVPNEETAIKIAVAVWSPIYGEDHIAGEKPYKATLKNGIWTVEGSLPEGYTNGGVATININQKDGKISAISHGK